MSLKFSTTFFTRELGWNPYAIKFIIIYSETYGRKYVFSYDRDGNLFL